ncbi:pantoate--beta-alanine ligase [Dinghuibacter silviterrae]|uniref:Pantothenate synthetase n=1 Tax=Dinghuibacter silviterrae TaxID=1539049 RepID=A0A4R8DUX9_9BACT|nr:pantoate--beta-alanine ligase [Dinghuibacter silviterrae]TDX02210.1 pantothenate synthetase [Dinghuibacter silviterrae]
MVICKTVADLRAYLSSRPRGPRLGFIPTMGALHDGHASLIREAKAGGRFTVCSVFVNPTQFNDPADFQKYPKTIESDILLLEQAGVDVLFLPSVSEIYPTGVVLTKHYDLGYLETVLEGAYRPGHFQGVCQVVERLLRIVQPDDLYMGQKDYQQCMVIRRLIELEQLPVVLVVCPIRREADGLAMSSRNLRLDAVHREGATAIYEALEMIRRRVSEVLAAPLGSAPARRGSGAAPEAAAAPLAPITAEARASLEAKGFRVDYVEIADGTTLQLLESWDGRAPAVALIAAFWGEVRLIDNEVLAPKRSS